MSPLNILHVFRAPVGGLFRHVRDLAAEQAARGHRVGVIADSSTGGERAAAMFDELMPKLALGLLRIPMRRSIGPADSLALARVMRRIAQAQADVIHGHGAKGGAYARLAFGARGALRVYTPHGGSLLYGHDTLAGRFYLGTERLLMPCGDLYLFESEYSAATFRRKIGVPTGDVRVVHNGVSAPEFAPVAPQPDATDLLFLGELREQIKGVDALLDAIALLHTQGRAVTATLVGDGPDRDLLHARAERLGLTGPVRFLPAMPARRAFELGRIMVVASRAESLPYVVLEAAAAGKPLIATRVGGIPEIYGPTADRLVPPGDAAALAAAVAAALDRPAEMAAAAATLRERVAAEFSLSRMVDGVLNAYRNGLETLRKNGRR